MQIEAWLARAARVAPDSVAIEAPEGARTNAQLLMAAQAGAEQLRARDVHPGQRVAIALPAGLSFAQALHACMLLGAVAVPVDLRMTADERKHIAAGAAIVVDEPLAEMHTPPDSGEYRHDLDAPAVVIYTSGTTSTPKPVELTYGNLLWSALGSAVALGLDPRERWLCALPLSHVGGLSILVRSAIYGTTTVVHERFDTAAALEAIQAQGITLVSLVATTLARLLDAGLREPPALRCALTGGGPVSGALIQRARAAGVPVCETYGLTECCSQAATAPAGVWAAAAPLFCMQVRIAEDSEILLRGPTVAPGSVCGDGWLHTGDLGRLDQRGFLHVTGRKADTIVSGGENVSPTEVEAVLESHPGVVEAAVLGRVDAQWGEAVHAIVVVSDGVGGELDEEHLRGYCASRLAPYKVPKGFTFVSEPLPRTRSGKLLRRELR